MSDLEPLDETRDLASGDLVPNDGVDLDSIPETIGRYRIDKVLGNGGFGLVYLAYDDQLDRPVAIKVPHGKLISKPSDAKAYLTEARTVANLDHPHIVPVHDVGSTDDYPCYIVSKFVEGTDLATRLKQQRLGIRASAELVATVAGALHYAHKQGLVHRDIKPSNILLGTDGKPYVVDFGLALREENIGKGPKYAGTPVYMSPEQVRGEGHRVDGRSDIFSLGVMFYEMLVGRRPFLADTQQQLMEQISTMEARPPRQIDDGVPKELERVCLKAISKRASNRYTTAQDFSDDLKHYLDQPPSSAETETFVPQVAPPTGSGSTKIHADSDTPNIDSDGQPIRIVPKGLRSFDAHDADFFLELLPGPRDRNGLPDSLRFWKTRIEETDPDDTFSIGLIYGPSGCGKSSLVKAGLLPRLNDDVISVYVEAAPDDTETRLLHGLRKRCPALDDTLNLKGTLAALRRGQGIPTGKKVLIVLDQFEQWLHAKKEEHNTELVQALRQCDGGRVQCIVMVRDDFWLGATRFMGELEVELLQGQNTALADLFDLTHARKVLRAFGSAFGRLPEIVGDTSREHREFLDQSVVGLSEEGNVICVRLALFSEMMKGKEWTPSALKEVGGTKGVGVNFLEETFSARTAHPKHRLHQRAARAVLKALLPDSGTDIKGEMKSYDELLGASGYATRPKDFDNLLKILDSEIRLITPTDTEGVESDDDSDSPFETGQKHYQLTHDYLVPSLRDWLTRKQRETRRGRAELGLAERSATWNAKPENRQLPSTLEWLRIHALTNHSNWSDPQRKMMQRANRVKGMFWSAVLALLVIAGFGIQQTMRRIAEQNTIVAVDSLQVASGNVVPLILKNLDELPPDLVLKELQDRFPESSGQPKLSLAYGLAHLDQVNIDAIIDGLVHENTNGNEMQNIVIALSRQTDQAITKLKSSASDVTNSQNWQDKARLAVVSMYLNDLTIAEEMLTATKPDPIQRTTFISEFPEWAFDIEAFTKNIGRLENAHFRSGICLSLGGIERLSQDAKDTWKGILDQWYLEAPDGGTHSAAGWALAQWKLALPSLKATSTPVDDRAWWHADLKSIDNPGLRFVKIPSGSVQGKEGPIVASNDYWLSDTEITIGAFQEFIKDDNYMGLKPDPEKWEGAHIFDDDKSSGLPMQQVSWFDSVMFCNWLSKRLGLDPCYELIEKTKQERDPYKQYSVKLLSTDGIRLPTEGEWEYVCRAQTATPFSFGDDDNRLVDYGWFERNSSSRTHQTGSKRCNAWGLFDMYGNVWEWCWDEQGSDRVCRGGCWLDSARGCQSSRRFWRGLTYRSRSLGFRVVRGPSSQACESSK